MQGIPEQEIDPFFGRLLQNVQSILHVKLNVNIMILPRSKSFIQKLFFPENSHEDLSFDSDPDPQF